MFVRRDRSRGLRPICSDEKLVIGEVSGFLAHGGRVRSELTNMRLAEVRVRSLVTNNCGRISRAEPGTIRLTWE